MADSLAAKGFIAIVPDFLSGKAPGGKSSESVDKDGAVALVRELDGRELIRRLNGAAAYATSLPSAAPEYPVVGFCWGGGISFNYAAAQPDLRAAVVFYGTSPETSLLAKINVPVLGFYGGDDNRVTFTVPPADQEEIKRLGKTYEYEIYDSAGQNGANLKAAQQAWPRMLAFLNQNF